MYLRIRGTGLFARDTIDGVHVVVSHVGTLRRLVLRIEGFWQVLWVHYSHEKEREERKRKESGVLETKERKDADPCKCDSRRVEVPYKRYLLSGK